MDHIRNILNLPGDSEYKITDFIIHHYPVNSKFTTCIWQHHGCGKRTFLNNRSYVYNLTCKLNIYMYILKILYSSKWVDFVPNLTHFGTLWGRRKQLYKPVMVSNWDGSRYSCNKLMLSKSLQFGVIMYTRGFYYFTILWHNEPCKINHIM